MPAPPRRGAEAFFAIIRFFAHNPLPVSGWDKRLVRHRTSLGLSQKEVARRLGVDLSTLARWERGEREPAGVLLGRAERFLNDGEEAERSDSRRAG